MNNNSNVQNIIFVEVFKSDILTGNISKSTADAMWLAKSTPGIKPVVYVQDLLDPHDIAEAKTALKKALLWPSNGMFICEASWINVPELVKEHFENKEVRVILSRVETSDGTFIVDEMEE